MAQYNFIDGANNAFISGTNNVWVNGDNVATSFPRLAYWDENYSNYIGPNLQYWDAVYSIVFDLVAYVDEVYGIQLAQYWNLPYDDNPIKTVFFDLLYGDNPILTQYWNLPYGDRQQLLKYWELKYGINKGILQHWDERYSMSAKEVLAYFDVPYDIQNTNALLKYFDEYYTIVSDSVVEEKALGFYIDGVKYEAGGRVHQR